MARQTDIRLRRSAVSGSVPTTSNLNLGELALNTADGKVYMKKSVGGTDTVVEVGSGSGISASFIAYEYTATANQTTFSGSDNNSNTLAYNTGTPPSVQVFMNGILLDEGSSQDYTGTNGTSVVLTTAADAGDLIQIHAYKSDVSIVSNLNFNDNQKLQFGDSQDLQIYHDGSQSIIQDVGTGQLKILGENTIHIGSATGSHSYIRALKSGAVELYHNNVKKFETTSTGVDVSGNLDASGTVFFNSDLRANNVSNKLIIKASSTTTELHAAGNSGIVFKDSGNGQVAALDTSGNLTTSGVITANGTSGSSFYGITLTRSSSGTTTPDLWGSSGTLVIGTSSSDEVLGMSGTAATFYGTLASGTFTSSGDVRADTHFNSTDTNATLSATGSGNVYLRPNGKSSTSGQVHIATSGNATFSGTISAGVFTTSANTGTFSNSIGSFPLMTSTPYDYVAKFESTDSGAAIIIEDNNSTSNANRVAVSGNTMKLVTAATTALTINASQNATFAGTISSGAITSSGAIVGSSVQSTGNLFGTNGLHTLNTAGNGWDHTINRNGGSPSANLPGGITSGNITTTGYLRGPSTFTIDPAAHGDDTGTVVIAGNLQIDGTTTTINSTTLTVDDKNITLASGAANAAAANGAGITVAGASANFVYESTNDRWTLNKEVFTAHGFMIGTTSTDVGLIKNSSGVFDFQAQSGREISFSNVTNGEHVRIDADGNVGIGTDSPGHLLHVTGADGSIANMVVNNDNVALRMSAYTNSHGEIRVETNHPLVFKTNGNNERMRITNAGDVGIGTTSPDAKLRIDQDAAATGLKVTGGSGGTNIAQFIRDVGANASVNINASGADPQIQFVSAGNTFALGVNSNTFEIADNSSLGANTRFSITNAGNVGIGITTPYYKLDTRFSDTTTTLSGGSSGNWGSNGIRIDNTNTTVGAMALAHFRVGDADWHIGNKRVGTDQADFIFANEGATKMLIDHTGNVGIGSTSPTEKLQFNVLSNTTESIFFEDNSSGNYGFKLRYIESTNKFQIQGLESGSQTSMFNINRSDGKVGIGTDSPDRQLELEGQGVLRLNATGSNTDPGIDFNTASANDMQIRYRGATDKLAIYSYGTSSDVVTIQKSDGNVGINETSPTTTLTVGGIVQIKESSNTAFYGANYVRMFGDQNYYFRNTGGATRAHISMADGDLNLYNSSTVLTNRISTNSDSYFNGGKVGIGTTAPSKKLHVEDSSAYQLQLDGGNNFWNVGAGWSGYYDGSFLIANNTGDKLVIDSNGKVGIGTNSPLDLLHIKSTSTDARQVIDGHTGFDAELKFAENGTVKYTIGHDAASDNFVIGTTNVDTQQRLVINSAGNVGIGVTSIPTWANLITDGTVAVGGTLYMKTDNAIQALSAFPGGASDLKMQTGGGKVTIGGPGGSTSGHLELYGRYSGSDPKLSFRSDHPTSGNTTVWDMARITADDGGNYNGVLHFQVAAGNGSANNGAALATAMTIQDTKYVGIGTTNPDTHLEVDIQNGADGNGIHITSTSTTNDPTLKLTRNGSADRFQLMVRGGAGSARLGISAGTNLDSGLNLGSNNGLSIGTVTAAGSGGLLVDNDIKSNSRFGVGSGGSLSDAAIYKNSDTNTGIYWPGTDQIALTTAGSNRLHIASNGGVSLNSQSQLTTGGNARLSIIDSSVQLSMGASNNDMSYIRKQGAGQFAWQTYNSGNSGILQLQPYGGNVTINTTAAVSGHALSVSGKIGGLTYSDSYVQFTGGNAILKANDDVVIGYASSLYVKQGGNVGVGTTDPQAQLQVKQLGINVNQSSVTSTSQYTCDSMSATVFRSARYTVQITNTTDSTYQITEILLIHDGTTPSMTEYSTIFTGSAREASFDADINSGNVRLLATPASTDSMQFKVVRHSILV